MQVPYQWITDSLIGVINWLIEEGRGYHVTNVQLLVSFFFFQFLSSYFLSDNLLMKGLTCFECTVARQRSFRFFSCFFHSQNLIWSHQHIDKQGFVFLSCIVKLDRKDIVFPYWSRLRRSINLILGLTTFIPSTHRHCIHHSWKDWAVSFTTLLSLDVG